MKVRSAICGLAFLLTTATTAEASFPVKPTLPKEQDLVMSCSVDDVSMAKDCASTLGGPVMAASPRTRAFLQIESANPDYLNGATPGARVQVVVRRSTAAPLDAANPGRATAPAASGSPPVVEPVWEVMPSQRDLDGYFPDRALRLSKSGDATLRCTVGPQGDLLGCWLRDESLPDMAFGVAAMRLSTFVKMRPMTKDGSPTAGRSYLFRAAFYARSAQVQLSSGR